MPLVRAGQAPFPTSRYSRLHGSKCGLAFSKDQRPKTKDQRPKTKTKDQRPKTRPDFKISDQIQDLKRGQSMTDSRTAPLAEVDPVISQAIDNEVARQANGLELIASENFVSEAVLGSCRLSLH